MKAYGDGTGTVYRIERRVRRRYGMKPLDGRGPAGERVTRSMRKRARREGDREIAAQVRERADD